MRYPRRKEAIRLLAYEMTYFDGKPRCLFCERALKPIVAHGRQPQVRTCAHDGSKFAVTEVLGPHGEMTRPRPVVVREMVSAPRPRKERV